MAGKAISTSNAPLAIGPYSQAIEAQGLLFASGQIAIDPATGRITAADITSQTHQVLKNLSAVLAAGDSALGLVVKTTVYLADLSDFEAMNRVYESYFHAPAPARATIQAARLPRDARVEIDAIALVRPAQPDSPA